MIKKKDLVDCIEQMKGKAVADTQILNLCSEIVNLSEKFKGSWIPMKDSPVNWVTKKWTKWSSKQCQNIWVSNKNPRPRFRGNITHMDIENCRHRTTPRNG